MSKSQNNIPRAIPDTTILVPEVNDLQTEIASVTYDMVVDSQSSLDLCSIKLKHIARWKKAVHDRLDPIVAQAHALHRSLTSFRNDVLAPGEAIEKQLRSKQVAYLRRVEEKRLAAEEELRRKAREEAEERRRAELAAQQQEAERLRLESQKLFKEGQLSKAADLARDYETTTCIVSSLNEQPVVVDYSAIEAAKPEAQAPSGVQVRRPWTFRIVTPSLVPREYLSINEMSIRDAMRAATKHDDEIFLTIPGVLFYRDTVTANIAG